jgi:HD-GYP domain-containing protein (c-di-GMP phosphodiesterase class II)
LTQAESPLVTHKLHHTTSELRQVYDATLDALSAALDLRDRQAKGHSRRVTEMALAMAGTMGVSDSKLVHIRRGALLHDIGNLLVPEDILHKQGELTVEEWVTIHMHPFYAYEMMSSIPFLVPALDIPYCHHEKWDGTGYPRGLKGEEIPTAARIFAVVDVWDALTSDRPYRKAWSRQEALEHIREQGGKHFDPKVVQAFLKLDPQ